MPIAVTWLRVVALAWPPSASGRTAWWPSTAWAALPLTRTPTRPPPRRPLHEDRSPVVDWARAAVCLGTRRVGREEDHPWRLPAHHPHGWTGALRVRRE